VCITVERRFSEDQSLYIPSFHSFAEVIALERKQTEKKQHITASRGQIGTFVYGLVFVLIAIIVMIMLQGFLNTSAENFTNGTIGRTIYNNLMPLVAIGVLVAVVGLFIGIRGK
jgi:NADH:ubiquinone oxidoreductase subunit 6 (subunit J)